MAFGSVNVPGVSWEELASAQKLAQEAKNTAENAAQTAEEAKKMADEAAKVEAAVPAREAAVTLTAAGWTGGGPFTQAVSVAGLAADSKGDIGLTQSATAEQRAAARDAMLSVTGQSAGSITVTADGDKPTVNIPAVVRILG